MTQALPDICIILRSSGENTEAISRKILEDAFAIPVHTLHISPFVHAVKKGYEIGIAEGKQYTLMVDADVLIEPVALKKFMLEIQKLPDNFFYFEGTILDKLFGLEKSGGPHFYRTTLMKQAYPFFDLLQKTEIRPESAIAKIMVTHGFHYYQGKPILGIHDYFQHPFDLFRKGYVYGYKFKKHIAYLESYWLNNTDTDFHIARAGLLYGLLNKKSENQPNADTIKKCFELSGFAPLKNAEAPQQVSVIDIILQHQPNPLAKQIKNDIARFRRSDRKNNYINLNRLGSLIKKLGERIQHLS